ncbi:DUF4424 family protein [Sediminicoccus sp. KRV36]|uniref:DUF4424 family protein n=1 Tax=Sediminicoccus sp. KRV36 TaxID=3133721 RepID=UPI00200E93CB|nr:DUF4424 family protein [Sediminicoccus rosea]UPY38226.1 DUF4424 domain-containing protein [Sediminicoccus rosea]
MLRSTLRHAALFLLLGGPPALANDSSAAIGLGGLTLTRSAEIRLDQQELFISRTQVRVNYVFTNTTDRDIETLVAFPLPDFTHSPVERVPDYARDLNFRTLVDGRPLALELVQRATFRGKDITDRLRGLGLPLVGGADERFEYAANALPEATRAALVREELVLGHFGNGRTTIDEPAWTVTSSITRRQIFPGGRSLRVQHSYTPFAGGSVGGRLSPRHRQSADFRAARAQFCMDDSFIAALDRRTSRAANGSDYSEVWLQYMLTPGGNWAGPIRDFRLVVDKGNPGSIVSFCGEGVRRLDDRRFEMRLRDVTPSRELDILIVDFHRD